MPALHTLAAATALAATSPAAQNSLDSYSSPFQKPLFNVPSTDLSGLLAILFLFVFLGWLVYTVTVAYHWFRYSHRSWLAVPAVGLHVIVSGLLIFYIASGVH